MDDIHDSEDQQSSGPVIGRFDPEAERWLPRQIIISVVVALLGLLIIAGAMLFLLQNVFTGKAI